MKKHLLLLGLLAGGIGLAHAQSVRFGAKAGAVYTSYVGASSQGAGFRWGFMGGLAADFKLSDLVSVQPELLYSQKGAKVETTTYSYGRTYTDSQTDRLHYLDIPVLLHIHADDVFFELGPQLGLLLAGKSDYSTVISGYGTTGGSTDLKEKGLINTVDFGYVAGLGYQLPSGPGFGLRYNGGLTNIVKPNSLNSDVLRNSAFQFYVSFMVGRK